MRRLPAVGDRLRELVPDRVGLSTRDGEPRFRLTRRGWVLAGLVVLLVLLGWQYGSRQINTVAVPVLADSLTHQAGGRAVSR
jgi:glutamyl/glutaminyl-tRNA synthetase